MIQKYQYIRKINEINLILSQMLKKLLEIKLKCMPTLKKKILTWGDRLILHQNLPKEALLNTFTAILSVISNSSY
jgi:hypothetical protein